MADNARKKDDEAGSEALDSRSLASTLQEEAFKVKPQGLVDRLFMHLVSFGFLFLAITLAIPDQIHTLLAIGIGMIVASLAGAFIVPSS